MKWQLWPAITTVRSAASNAATSVNCASRRWLAAAGMQNSTAACVRRSVNGVPISAQHTTMTTASGARKPAESVQSPATAWLEHLPDQTRRKTLIGAAVVESATCTAATSCLCSFPLNDFHCSSIGLRFEAQTTDQRTYGIARL